MSKTAKILTAVLAVLLALCLALALFGFVGCGDDDGNENNNTSNNNNGDDENGDEEDEVIEFPLAADHFLIATTFGVTLITGQDLSMANLRVYVVLDGETDDDKICICGMGATDAYKDDNFTLVDSTGDAVDSLTITSTSMSVTMKYTGTNYTFTDSTKTTFTGTIAAVNATSAAVVSYTLDRSGDPETYAQVGDGADAMTVVVYYEGGSDTHADNTITVTNANGGSVLAEGLNTIAATTVCTDSNGNAVSVPTVYLNVARATTANSDETYTYTYTAYSSSDMSGTAVYSYTIDVYLETASVTVGKSTATKYSAYSDSEKTDLLYTYTIDASGSDVYAVLKTSDKYSYMGVVEIENIVVTLYYDGSCNLDCSMMDGYTNWSWAISGDDMTTMTFTISSLGGDCVGTITYNGNDIQSIVFSSFGGTTLTSGSEMTFTPVFDAE